MVAPAVDDPTSPEGRNTILFGLSKSAYIDSGYFEIAAESIAEAATRGLNVSRAAVWLIADDQSSMLCCGLVEDNAIVAVEGVALLKSSCSAYFEEITANRIIAAEDIFQHPLTTELARSYCTANSITSLIGVPLSFDGRVAGMISCENRQSRKWSEADQSFITGLTEISARALAAVARQHAEDALNVARTGIESQVAERTRTLRQALGQLQQAQSQLIQTEKMAALGTLVAGVAHEINTPIGISVTAASHLKETVKDLRTASASGQLTRVAFQQFLDDTLESADILLRNLERAAVLVQSFKRVAVNHSDESVSDFDLRSTLQDLMLSVSPEFKRCGISYSLECAHGIKVHSYLGALDQVVTNLLVNALRHAFVDKGGSVKITATADAAELILRIADNGAGIEPALLPRIFDPFVTTRREDGGTGLGLHISHNLIYFRLRGRIEVDSEVGKGTTFTLIMPTDVGATDDAIATIAPRGVKPTPVPVT